MRALRSPFSHRETETDVLNFSNYNDLKGGTDILQQWGIAPPAPLSWSMP